MSAAAPRTSSGENRPSVSPHTLRRTFGSDLINRGVRLETVSRLLGRTRVRRSPSEPTRSYSGHTIPQELFEAFLRRDLQ